MSRMFGTDGVRGVMNEDLNCALAMDIGTAVATILKEDGDSSRFVIIGKDTRKSGDMLESALAAGLCSAGFSVGLVGVLPTPAIAYLIGKYGASAGIVISASHNPYQFNGIKIFGPKGFKLPDETEDRIQACIEKKEFALAKAEDIGTIRTIETAVDDYVASIVPTVSADLSGIKYIVDCANGASSTTAGKLFSQLGGDYEIINASPDGININNKCGSTNLAGLAEKVKEKGCDLGIAFDGDADRCLAIDENGNEINGDQLIGVFAKHLKDQGKLSGNAAVVTVMSNIGFANYCQEKDIEMVRTKVGDRYVLEKMLEKGYVIGGEQSGHIILLDRETTGDGEMAAALLLETLSQDGRKASEIFSEVIMYPQTLINVTADKAQKEAYTNDEGIKAFIAEKERSMGEGNGRVLVRLSGTEPLIRVMVEGKDQGEIEILAGEIAEEIRRMFCQ